MEKDEIEKREKKSEPIQQPQDADEPGKVYMRKIKRKPGHAMIRKKEIQTMKPQEPSLNKLLQDLVDILRGYNVDHGGNKKLEGIATWLKRFRTIVINLIILIFIFLLIFFIYHEVRKDIVLIEPFEVPEELKEKGYSGRVITNRLIDKINFIRTTLLGAKITIPAKQRMKKEILEIKHTWSEQQIKLEFIGGGISVNSIILFCRKLFRHEPTHIVGEVVIQNKQMYTTIHINGKRQESIPGDLKEPGKKYLLQAAKQIYKQLEPFTLALYLYEKDKEACLETIKYVLSNEPRNDDSLAYSLWGLVLREKGDCNGAIDKYEKAIEIDPRFANAYNSLGSVLRVKKQYKRAIDNYKKAIEIDPNFTWPYNNWGYALQVQGDYDGAIDKYKKAIDLDPNFAFVYNNWGNVLFFQKDYDGAIDKYKKAIELDPNFTWPYDNWGYTLEEQGDYEGAIDKYKKAIDRDSEDTFAYNHWGFVLQKQKDYDGAIEKYKEAIKHDPKNALAYNNWGNALFEQELYESAIEKYKEAIKHDPKNVCAYFGWSAALKKNNKDDKGAFEKFQKGIELCLDPLLSWILYISSLVF